MKAVWESPQLLDSPIVRLGDDEYFLYPIHADGLATDGFYPLGQNELGAAIFLGNSSSGNALSVFECERSGERNLLHEDAQAFFERISNENR